MCSTNTLRCAGWYLLPRLLDGAFGIFLPPALILNLDHYPLTFDGLLMLQIPDRISLPKGHYSTLQSSEHHLPKSTAGTLTMSQINIGFHFTRFSTCRLDPAEGVSP